MRVEIVGTVPPGTRLLWQSRAREPIYVEPTGGGWDIEVPTKDGVWTGPMVGKNSDGRRFLYFAWLDDEGSMFGRIKLYQNQVVGDVVRLAILRHDGSPAFSTAQIAE